MQEEKQEGRRVIVEPYLIREGAEEAVTRLLRDGVEFRATEEVLARWLEKHGFLTTALPKEGLYGALSGRKASLGARLVGRDTWPTYHEMLADLLARIDANGGVS